MCGEKEKICDICGNSCNVAHKGFKDPNGIISNEFATLTARWGYCSNKDLTEHECIMCEECFDEVLAIIYHMGGKVRRTSYGN